MCKGGRCDPGWLRTYGMDQTAREEEERMENETTPDVTTEEIHVAESAVPTRVFLMVHVPADYSEAEYETFKRLLHEAIVPVARDAALDIDSERVANR